MPGEIKRRYRFTPIQAKVRRHAHVTSPSSPSGPSHSRRTRKTSPCRPCRCTAGGQHRRRCINERCRHAIKTADVSSVIPDFQQEHQDWITEEQHTNAKAAVEASEAKAAAKASEKAGEEEDSHKRQKTGDATQQATPPQEETTTAAASVPFPLAPAPGPAPVSLDGLVGSSNPCPWIKTIDLLVLIASGNAPGITPRNWMRKLTEARIRQVGAQAMESKLARSLVHRLLDLDARRLGQRGAW